MHRFGYHAGAKPFHIEPSDAGEKSPMTKRKRSLLVLAPQARGADELQQYKPFGGRSLGTVLRDVAVSISRQAYRRADEHSLFLGFLFGRVTLDAALIEELRAVQSSLVDCAVYTNPETDAETTARKALDYFADTNSDGSKSMALMCRHDCRVETRLPVQRMQDDDGLFAHLWLDLCGEQFRQIAQMMARRWGG
jgi:hypothetical protein